MPTFECIFPGNGESFVIDRHPSVIPPDNATMRLAANEGQRIAVAQCVVSPLFAEAEGRADPLPSPARIVDLGSGTGALGIAAVRKALQYGAEVASLTAIELDEAAVDNTQANFKKLVEEPYPEIETNIVHGSWFDDAFWDSIGSADLILCNPPYLSPDGDYTIRKGFEGINPSALYLPDNSAVFGLYRDLLSRSLANLRPFGVAAFRLPKFEPTYNDKWPFALAATPEVGNALDALQDTGTLVNIMANRHEPRGLLGAPIGDDTIRHLHTLTAESLPRTYPYIGIFGDPAYVHWANGHGTLDTKTYTQFLEMAGYPHTAGGGHLSSEYMMNYNYPDSDPRHRNV